MTNPNPYGPIPVWFPTPYTIQYFVWTGGTEKDPNTGNDVESWAEPVEQAVQGWDIFDSAKLPGAEREVDFSMYLMVPPFFWPNIRDRFGIPIPSSNMLCPTVMFNEDGSVAPGIFEVTGHDIETFGFANWAPGNVILLKDLA